MIQTLGPLSRLGEISTPRARIAPIGPIAVGIVRLQDLKSPRGRGPAAPGAADDGTVDMAQSTDHTALDQTLDGLLAEAAGALEVLPPIADCERLERELRRAIRDLAEQVRGQLAHYPRGSIDWNARDQALLAAQYALTGTLGDGLRSAARQVAALGERARELREIAGR